MSLNLALIRDSEQQDKEMTTREKIIEGLRFKWFAQKNKSYLEHKTNQDEFTRGGIHFASWWDVFLNISARPNCTRPVLLVGTWGMFITWNGIYKKVTFAELDDGMSPATFETVTFIVSLLVVFRLGESHKRYLDARVQWGGMVNRSRDLTRQFFGYCDDISISTKVCNWVIAYAFACKQSLRWKANADEAGEWLDASDLGALNASRHMPSYCLERLTRHVYILPRPLFATFLRPASYLLVTFMCSLIRTALDNKQIDTIQAMALDRNVTALEDYIGACERVLKTPVPFGKPFAFS
jgi:predicted membrane chloride channel (bestrophin family)